MWPEILDVEFVPSPEGRGEWTHLQSSGGHCRDGSGSEHGDECNAEKPSAGGPEHLDGSHPLSQAICCVCGRRGYQHSHLESHGFPINCPGDSVSRPSRPDRRTILTARGGLATPTAMSYCSLLQRLQRVFFFRKCSLTSSLDSYTENRGS